jgi:hypothetical protein
MMGLSLSVCSFLASDMQARCSMRDDPAMECTVTFSIPGLLLLSLPDGLKEADAGGDGDVQAGDAAAAHGDAG